MDDLLGLHHLDQKLWVALACPTKGIEFDERTLALIDTDKDETLRAPELLQAIQWAVERLADPQVLCGNHHGLPLDAVRTDTEEGKRLRSTAEHLLQSMGRTGETTIGVAEASQGETQFGTLPDNGDGVIDAKDCRDDALGTAVHDIIAAVGSVPDRWGNPGIDLATVERFFNAARALTAWHAQAPDQTLAGALKSVDAVRAKIDDFFVRARLAAFDERTLTTINGDQDTLNAIARHPLSNDSDALAALPLAKVSPGAALPLDARINPAWVERVETFKRDAVQPLLGARNVLSESDWTHIQQRLAKHAAWLQAKPAESLDKLPPDRISALLQGDTEARLKQLIAADSARAPEAAAIADVERLARYVRDLLPLANNFAAFREFYLHQGKATFQVGTLYLDGRSAELVVAVNDPARHQTMAGLSRLFLVYCECKRRDDAGQHKMVIAAAFTEGDSDQLIVGRNGVFYDRKGHDWNAAITRVVEQPISLRQAFWTPYKRLARFINEQIQKLAANEAGTVDNRMSLLASGLVQSPTLTPPPAAANNAKRGKRSTAFDVGKFAGIFAAVGLAIGAIGTALASLITGLLDLPWWQTPLAIAGIVLLVSGPSVVIAWFKLRTRTLGPLLDANGWAVNARARINIPFGTSLTRLAKLPPDAARALPDPYKERLIHPAYIVALAAAAGAAAYLHFF